MLQSQGAHPLACFVVARNDNLLLLDREGKRLQCGVLMLENRRIEAIIL
jgi:hypothetical protein